MSNFQLPNPGFSSRINFYAPKGDGRDTYISFNNGGIWKKNYTDGLESVQAQYFRSPRYFSKKPNIPAKNVHYPPDGTGRDVFIKFDEGGILQNFNIAMSPNFKNYITSLRSYNKSSYGKRPKIPDFFTESQHALSLKDYSQVCKTAQSQRNLMKRLLVMPEHKIPAIKYVKNKKDTNNRNALPKIL